MGKSIPYDLDGHGFGIVMVSAISPTWLVPTVVLQDGCKVAVIGPVKAGRCSFVRAIFIGRYDGFDGQEEQYELRPLLGLYGMETETRLPAGRANVDHVEARAQRWYARQFDRDPIRSQVVERAITRCGLILEELAGVATFAPSGQSGRGSPSASAMASSIDIALPSCQARSKLPRSLRARD